MPCKTQRGRQDISHAHLQWAQIMVEGKQSVGFDFFFTEKLSKILDAFIKLVITFKGL